MQRWPQFQLTDEHHGLFQEEGGIAMAARATAAHQRMAREHGATLQDRSPVTSVRPVGGEVEVVAGDVAYRCRKLCVAAGPWSNRIMELLNRPLPLEVTKEQVTYYASPYLKEFEPGRFPVWIWMDDPCYYGFPVFGEAATKIAQDTGGKVTTADTRTFEPDPENSARVETWAKRYLPRALGPVLYTKTCLYTLTPDRDFVIDRVPGHENIQLAIGGRARLQVRFGHRTDPERTGAHRRHTVGYRRLLAGTAHPQGSQSDSQLHAVRLALALLFVVAGLLHFIIPAPYRVIMPPWLPAYAALIAISGAAEVAGGIGLLLPATRRAAGIGLMLLLVAVFPANVQMLLLYRARGVVWWGELLLWFRLPLQFLLIWGVWRVTRPAQQ